MAEPKTRADAIDRLLPWLLHWSIADERIGGFRSDAYAVETPDGLVVPVIRNADELSVRGLARAIGDLALRARDGQLTPDDLSGKTFTISNPGRKGNLVGGAIISQPNVGILRMGEIKKRVVVVENEGVDTMAIHKVMFMALSYDHRVVDGVEANGFLYRIHELLQGGDFEV